jgi:hypothetical protein
MLLDRRFFEMLPKRFDVGRDMQRLDVGQLADLVLLAPAKAAVARRSPG